jgi:lipoprotein-anchoring transpeptidase ErfK/SrfK
VYGVLAMGVSGFSEQLPNWPEGGQLGIHGTNDPSSVGKDVSHGCIRLYNEDILDLSEYVAYGTPVSIQE